MTDEYRRLGAYYCALAAHMRNAEPVERRRETRFNISILALTVAGVLGMFVGLVLGKL